jgi:hypothetical protein
MAIVSNFTYDSGTLTRLMRATSAARLAPYLSETQHDAQAAVDLYVWNIKASARLYGPLSIFEVVLRNALNDRLAVLFSPDWPSDTKFGARHGSSTIASSRPVYATVSGRGAISRSRTCGSEARGETALTTSDTSSMSSSPKRPLPGSGHGAVLAAVRTLLADGKAYSADELCALGIRNGLLAPATIPNYVRNAIKTLLDRQRDRGEKPEFVLLRDGPTASTCRSTRSPATTIPHPTTPRSTR